LGWGLCGRRYLTLQPGDEKTCTITNTYIPPERTTLTLVKTVLKDDGGTAEADDFQAHIDGLPVAWNTPIDVEPGSRTVSETVVSGYAAGDWGGDCDANGNVTLEPGDNKTCTITNDDIAPTLTLEKTVVNDDEGTAGEDDFQAYIDGGPVDWDAPQTLDAGSHTASEDVVPGYVADDWGGDCDPRGNVTLGPGESKTCTITNRDLPPVLVGGATVAPREVQMLVLRLAIIGLTGLLGSATGLILWRRKVAQR
jgi:hypothetical protein